MPNCVYEGCDRIAQVRGEYCRKHYERLQKTGKLRLVHIIQDGCNVPGCNKKHKSLGFCAKHYVSFKKHGTPTPHIKTQEESFSERVETEPNSGCWLWTGVLYSNGYACFSFHRKKVLAHRWAYEHFVGPIPHGLQLDHLCRVRCCVNPQHLEPVTARENLMRGTSWSAINFKKTHCKYGHPFDADNVILTKRGARQCKTCMEVRAQKQSTEEPKYCKRGHELTRRTNFSKNKQRLCETCRIKKLGRYAPKKPPRTHCSNGHEINLENTYTEKGGQKRCKPCMRESVRRFQHARKLSKSLSKNSSVG